MGNKSNYLKLNSKSVKFLTPLLAVFSLLPAQAQAADLFGGFFNGFLGSVTGFGTSVINGLNSVIGNVIGTVGSFFDSVGLGWLFDDILGSITGQGECGQKIRAGIGDAMCQVVISSNALPGLISGIAYMAGLILAVTAMLKLKEHVLNPDRTPISESMKRFVAGGAFFSLPTITAAVTGLVSGNGEGYQQSGGFNNEGLSTTGGLDSMVSLLVADIWEPLQILLSSFSYLAGLVFVVIGIGRLIKTAQDGPRGPSGVGTIMTFVTAGVLFSLDAMMGAFSSSMFGSNDIKTYVVLNSRTGDVDVDGHVEAMISAVVAFMALVGWISFIRGFFIMRDVAEGNGQASLMSATTHMFGGALAVNLGPVINAVQTTMGLTPYGMTFYN
jgi:hypothetical protein